MNRRAVLAFDSVIGFNQETVFFQVGDSASDAGDRRLLGKHTRFDLMRREFLKSVGLEKQQYFVLLALRGADRAAQLVAV